MFATFFLAAGALFFWLVFKGYSDQEIKGRGWGFRTQIYRATAKTDPLATELLTP